MSTDFLKRYGFYFALVCMCFALTKLFNINRIHDIIRLLIFPILIFLFFKKSNRYDKFFLGFLICFALAEISYYYIYANGVVEGPMLLVCNAMFILGYTFLIVFIISNLNLKQLIKRLPIQIAVLSIVGIYLFLEINAMIPFQKTNLFTLSDGVLNVIYNLIIIIALNLSLLNYFYNDSRLALRLLLACTALIFSEFFQIVYYYGHDTIPTFLYNMIDKIYITLLAISYFIFFLFIKTTDETPIETSDSLNI